MAQAYFNAIDKVFEDETMKDKITEDDKNKIMPLKENLDETLKAYEKVENKDEALKNVEDAQKALEDVYNPIIAKLYAEANPQAAQGFSAQDFSNMFTGGGNSPFNGATNA